MRSSESAMSEMLRPRVKYVIGPDGSPLTIADLPPPSTKRWVIRRKAEVVAAVRGGLLSLEDACSRYTLTVDEFLSWQYSIDQHGLAGLRTTRIQQYRLSGCYWRYCWMRVVRSPARPCWSIEYCQARNSSTVSV